MAHLKPASDTEALLQSMLQKLKLHTSEDEKLKENSEDLDAACLSGEVQECRNHVRLRTKPGVVSPASRRHGGLWASSTHSTEHRDDEEEMPRWDRKQMIFSYSRQNSEKSEEITESPEENITKTLNSEEPKSYIGRTEENLHLSMKPSSVDQALYKLGHYKMKFPQKSTSDRTNAARTSGGDDHGEVKTQLKNHKRKWSETKTKKWSWKKKDKRTQNEKAMKLSEEKESQPIQPSAHQVSCQSSTLEQSYVMDTSDQDSEDFSNFDLGLGSISLMEELFTEPEWTRFISNSQSETRPTSQQQSDQFTTSNMNTTMCSRNEEISSRLSQSETAKENYNVPELVLDLNQSQLQTTQLNLDQSQSIEVILCQEHHSTEAEPEQNPIPAPQLIPLLDLSFLKSVEVPTSPLKSPLDRRTEEDEDEAELLVCLSRSSSPSVCSSPLDSLSLDSSSSLSTDARRTNDVRRVRFAKTVTVVPPCESPDEDDWTEEPPPRQNLPNWIVALRRKSKNN
ncbi:uncharacterized protein LOC114782454 isoform X2 [Denticeps clupeoides]|uniref:uncharacterized protein LOC114782454 isoform X2 n=1 Tax=Denticeps clupeoides TaxID=299321 RepID=UPI0010A308F4|nr:uncharacterized protein LOC114782454 isoform X2 [Denticeps clupeoides]